MLTQACLVFLVALALAQAAVIATSIYLHRGLAHRSLALHPVADLLFRVLLWLTTGQRRREWVAVHRKHHTFTDREGDPHSPRLLGFWRVQIFNVYYYAREARNPSTLATFAPDIAGGLAGAQGVLPRLDWSGARHRPAVQPSSGSGRASPPWLTHAALYVFVLAPLINGLGHWHGAQNFRNTAYNWRVPRLGDGRGEPAQQPPRLSARRQVQRAPARVRPVVGGDPRARRHPAHRHHRDVREAALTRRRAGADRGRACRGSRRRERIRVSRRAPAAPGRAERGGLGGPERGPPSC